MGWNAQGNIRGPKGDKGDPGDTGPAGPVDQSRVFAAGDLVATARATAREGWLLCDGSAISRTTYAALFAAISTSWGAGNGSTTFNVPNFRGRVPAGLDTTQAEFTPLGKTGGAKTHTLTVDEMPSHTHAQNAHTHTNATTSDPRAGTQNGNSIGYGSTSGPASRPVGISSTTATNQNTGGGDPHNNLQPYGVVNYMIKI